MALRPCLGSAINPLGHTLANGSRCPACAAAQQRVKDTRRPRRRTAAETRRRREAVAAHVDLHGWVCPGWRREPHPSQDLTADHVVAVGAGGREEGPLTVLCRSCNSARGSR